MHGRPPDCRGWTSCLTYVHVCVCFVRGCVHPCRAIGSMMITTPPGAPRQYTLSYYEFVGRMETDPGMSRWCALFVHCPLYKVIGRIELHFIRLSEESLPTILKHSHWTTYFNLLQLSSHGKWPDLTFHTTDGLFTPHFSCQTKGQTV